MLYLHPPSKFKIDKVTVFYKADMFMVEFSSFSE